MLGEKMNARDLYSDREASPARPPWWKLYGERFGWSGYARNFDWEMIVSMFKMTIVFDHLEYGGGDYTETRHGGVYVGGTGERLFDFIKKEGFTSCLYSGNFVHPRMLLQIDMTRTVDGVENIAFNVYEAGGKKFFERLQDYIGEATVNLPPPKHEFPGHAYVMVDRGNGVELVPVGMVGCKLNRTNYNELQTSMFDKIVRDIESSRPSGRLSILDGPPGTGKTYFIRGLMAAANQSQFVIVPPHMISRLAEPSMIMTYVSNASNSFGPMVLVMEDADECLRTRTDGNMSLLSSVLNLSDNILGHCLDLRIIASTNTPTISLDKAVQRPGRMNAHINFGSLGSEHALHVWNSLASKSSFPLRGMESCTLADVYKKYDELTDAEKSVSELAELMKEEQEMIGVTGIGHIPQSIDWPAERSDW